METLFEAASLVYATGDKERAAGMLLDRIPDYKEYGSFRWGDLLFRIGGDYQSKNDYPKAAALYARIAVALPGSDEEREATKRLIELQKLTDGSAAALLAASAGKGTDALTSKSVEARLALIEPLIAERKFDEAEKLCQTVLVSVPTGSTQAAAARTRIARVYRSTGRYALAFREYIRVVEEYAHGVPSRIAVSELVGLCSEASLGKLSRFPDSQEDKLLVRKAYALTGGTAGNE